MSNFPVAGCHRAIGNRQYFDAVEAAGRMVDRVVDVAPLHTRTGTAGD